MRGNSNDPPGVFGALGLLRLRASQNFNAVSFEWRPYLSSRLVLMR